MDLIIEPEPASFTAAVGQPTVIVTDPPRADAKETPSG